MHLTWGNDDSKDGSFKNSPVWQIFVTLFWKTMFMLWKKCWHWKGSPFPRYQCHICKYGGCLTKAQNCAMSSCGVGRCNCSMGANVILRSHRVRFNLNFFPSPSLSEPLIWKTFSFSLQRQYVCWFEAFLNKLVVLPLVRVYFLAVALLLQLLCNCSGRVRRGQKV